MTAFTSGRLAPLLAAAALALAGCHASVRGDNNENASITIGSDSGEGGAGSGNGQQSVAIDVPGFSAKVNVPDLDIGGDTKIEDMPLFPGTKVSSVNISADHADGSGGDSKGNVNMSFSAPGKAADVVSWYRDQAGKNGWTQQPPGGANQFEATKADSGSRSPTHFALQVADGAHGSTGRFLVTGR